MPKLPPVSGKKLLKVLEEIGFTKVRQKGSHIFLAHLDGRKTVVPVHGNQSIPPGTLMAILHDVQMTKEDLIKMI